MQLNSNELRFIEEQARKIVKKAGEEIMRSWHSIKSIEYKNRRDTVSNVDREVEGSVRHQLAQLLPDAGFEVEEGLTQKKSEYNWVIDPIDGTKNYVTQLPVFVTQFALTYQSNPVLACIYNPVSDQLFSASQGNGTSLNGEKIKLKFLTDPQAMVVDIDLGKVETDENWKIEAMRKISQSFFRVRIFGGVFSIYMLTGAIDAVIVLNLKTKYYDQAPRIMLSREAGLKSEYIEMKNGSRILTTASPAQFEFISQLLTSV